jgi:hypothetical protein
MPPTFHIPVYKRLLPYQPRNKIEIESDEITLKDDNTHLLYSSPCREKIRIEEKSLEFKTASEEENMMCSDGVNWAQTNYSEYEDNVDDLANVKVVQVKVVATKTKDALHKAQQLKDKSLYAAIMNKMGASNSGPASPTYDKWNQGYKKEFTAELRKRHVWAQIYKIKRGWGPCETGCHWCAVIE